MSVGTQSQSAILILAAICNCPACVSCIHLNAPDCFATNQISKKKEVTLLQGYPGKVRATVTYTLTESATLLIDFEAQTDKATPINLAQHTYFNLDGVDKGQSILDHVIQINRRLIFQLLSQEGLAFESEVCEA